MNAAHVIALVLAIAATPLGAQRLVTQTLDSAATVRLRLFRGGSETGRLRAPFGPDSSIFRYTVGYDDRRTRRDVERPAGEVARVEVPHGTQSWEGFLIGTTACAVPLLALAYVSWAVDESVEAAPYAERALVAMGLSVAVCGLVGAAIGAGTTGWARAP